MKKIDLPKHKNPNPNGQVAVAPYNFVPLPEQIITVSAPPDQDTYHPDETHYTGHIECTLKTETPLYTRSMVNPEFFREHDKNKFHEPDPAQQDQRAQFFHLGDAEKPVIPGSSLRGMVRALVEIISYSKVQPVTNTAKMFFRAVADPKDDPLAQPYQDALGKYGGNVKAGYLVKKDERWWVRPALGPQDIGLKKKETYLKVKGGVLKQSNLPGFMDFNHPDYIPQYHNVTFTAETRKDKKGKEYTAVTDIGPVEAGYSYQGVLVCSGNMLETKAEGETHRKNYSLVLSANKRASLIPINEQAVIDYRDTLTDFEKQSPPFNEDWGCLIEGRPVFYVEERGEIFLFGHTPNFRVPMYLSGEKEKRAAHPQDFVPEALRREQDLDLAEAIFGYTKRTGEGKERAYAGRVFFGDAELVPGQTDIWLSEQPITPKIMAGPKPTTFQHYLVQDTGRGHSPNDKKSLAHYGTSPDETVIRGHKLYWHKGNITLADIKEDPQKLRQIEEDEKEKKKQDKQHTRIKPVKAGVRFTFRVRFENLSDTELGALLWALTLPGATGKEYRHKLGMGKAYGLGSVELKPTLYLSDRRGRYETLFAGDAWHTAIREADDELEKCRKAFEDGIVRELGVKGPLASVERIQMLLALLQWPGPDREQTRYMEIERQSPHSKRGKINEYRDRPVLPDPLAVWKPSPPGPLSQRARGGEKHPASSHREKGGERRSAPSPREQGDERRSAPQPRQQPKPQVPPLAKPEPSAPSQFALELSKRFEEAAPGPELSHPASAAQIKAGMWLEGEVLRAGGTQVVVGITFPDGTKEELSLPRQEIVPKVKKDVNLEKLHPKGTMIPPVRVTGKNDKGDWQVTMKE
jgi:CRISPR-associated protein (TIGR03986 family)